MAFHFDARADSSDDDTNGAIDISSWKTGAGPKAQPVRQAPAPVAPMLGSTQLDNDLRSVSPDVAALQISASRKRKRTSPLRSSFEVINRPSPIVDEGFAQPVPLLAPSEPAAGRGDTEEEPHIKSRASDNAKLVVEISRAEGDAGGYEDYTTGRDRVRMVLREWEDDEGSMMYNVMFDDFHTGKLPFDQLLDLENGEGALAAFELNPSSEEQTPPPSRPATHKRPEPRLGRERLQSRSKMSSRRRSARPRPANGFVSTVDNVAPSDGEESVEEVANTRTTRRGPKQDTSQYIDVPEEEDDDGEEEDSEDELNAKTRSSLRNRAATNGWKLRRRQVSTSLTESEHSSDDLEFLTSDIPGAATRRAKRKRGSAQHAKSDRVSKKLNLSMRQSERATRHKGDMQEVEVDDIYRSDSAERVPAKPKLSVTREIFKPLPRNNDFRIRHTQWCESCGQGTNFAPLIYCQGCSLAYHKSCLGHRTNRDHLVTKVGAEDFVLQCRRCVAVSRKKDPTAPDQGKCQECRRHGAGCRPFRPRKTPSQEQKEREDNDGVDPVYPVDPNRLYQYEQVLFRCTSCFRGFHFEHLPSRSDVIGLEGEADPEQRFREYAPDWKCKECVDVPAKVSGLIAWKPLEEDNYDPALGFEGLDEDEKVYLVRYEGMSYFRARWMPGPWVWGITAHSMRKAFAKRDDTQHPTLRTEDAIPEDYLRTDIVLDIRFTNYVDIRTEEVDKARIREVDKALIKYKGLGYEDAVWEAPPSPDDGERWSDFVMAYNDWVAGRYVRQPKAAAMKTRLEKLRKEDFAKLEKSAQPDNVQGGTLMEYQIQGLNWLYYKWYTQKNAVLADEMGLGKTIQIIGFLATLVQDHSCYPFLIVVPNSTCPNWRREIKRWAPGLRVVAYYGSQQSRDLAYRHELYPEGSKDLRCHVVVTSYDAAADENCRKFFRGVPWQGLIVDEGQRLKNDKNLLYAALGALKAPFKILLTGTPLQNNTRELFNLLHFLDDSYNAAELEKEFEDLDQDKINKLHEMIRPFFLRRTKAQVLTFLPPMAQIIVPVSMSLVQKKLYRSILAKNPDLMKAIFSTETNVKQAERASLSNILMQLRKCLCHPFVYNKSIEDRNVDIASSHRNLVDASSKLMLLEILLPKLKERGHRVLIFSQFLEMLDMVEDFLDGMELRYQRLDGSMNSLTKQKRIDEFNAPESPLFAFLLSTRAGGVGINLASADTVIILDPDFNPHHDIQALSRAHRIGQNRKVLCFQLVTRASAEERVMQIGRRKLALDHVLIQEMNEEDAEQTDLVSVLRYGANELFQDNGDQDIVYDVQSVDRLLDRSHMEDTRAGEDKSAETQFSFARVWANDSGALQDAAEPEIEESMPDPGVWANILKERERVAAEEAAAKAEAFGRGRRARANIVDYTGETADGVEITPIKRGKRKQREGSGSDTDFRADESDDEDHDDGEDLDDGELKDLGNDAKQNTGQVKNEAPTFRRAIVPKPEFVQGAFEQAEVAIPSRDTGPASRTQIPAGVNCRACQSFHTVGNCPLKRAGVEYCNLCGVAHFGHARVCPHVQSETQVRAMLEALKYSNEPEHLVNEARRYLRGLKGNLVQNKKQKEAKAMAEREANAAEAFQRSLGGYGGAYADGGGNLNGYQANGYQMNVYQSMNGVGDQGPYGVM